MKNFTIRLSVWGLLMIIIVTACKDNDSNILNIQCTSGISGTTIADITSTGLRKKIDFFIQNPNTAYEIGSVAVVARHSNSSQYGYGVIPVTNISSSTRCFIKLKGITYFDYNGAVLDTCTTNYCNNFDYVEGTVQDYPNSEFYTSTCLKPSQTGYVLFIENSTNGIFYDSVANMTANQISDDTDGFSEPKGKLCVVSEVYSNSSVTVEAGNTGTEAVRHALSKFVLQDANKGFLMQ